MEHLLKLKVKFDEELAIDIVLHSLSSCYDQFILAYHLNNPETTLAQLHNLLRTDKAGRKGKSVTSTPAASPFLAIDQGKEKKRKGPPKQNWKGKSQAGSTSNGPKGKASSDAPTSNPKEATCLYCHEKGN